MSEPTASLADSFHAVLLEEIHDEAVGAGAHALDQVLKPCPRQVRWQDVKNGPMAGPGGGLKRSSTVSEGVAQTLSWSHC